jgi:phosphoglycerol transferase MdoB-like AlkP superfamily enzyme
LFSKLPKNIQLVLSVVASLLLLMTCYRLFFYAHYKPLQKPFSGSMLLLGLRYDTRVAAVVGFLIYLAAQFFNTIKSNYSKKILISLTAVLFFILLISYALDFYYYDYLKQRLSASIIGFMQDAAISTKMVWQTYPVFKITIAIVLCVLCLVWGIKKYLNKLYLAQNNTSKKANIFSNIIYLLLTAAAIFGRVGQYPLRWSDAFTLSDDFKANAALNPIQSFISTYQFKNTGYDLQKTKDGYLIMANYLGINNANAEQLSFERTSNQITDSVNKKNIVIVICESFSAYKSSMFGNGLNATPYFNNMCNNGIFFERCFTPAFGTARGVWATLTGIPDVQQNKTASRNPAAVNQRTIMNQFTGYDKFYFLGGSTTWANIRGLLTNNIEGLKIYEEGDFNASKVDVWGISDKNLFLEANKVFANQNKPFVSIIQTADNHRPYTIPTEDLAAFKKVNYPADTLAKYGFDDNGQLNAFRYTDFCFSTFIEAAKKEKYFNNTIFVFVGDHGLRGNAGNMFPQSFTSEGILAEHVPLLFYAPSFLPNQKIKTPASQLDIFPSVAFLAKQNITNSTLGVNLFDSSSNKKRVAFIADPDMNTIGIVSDSFYWRKNLTSSQENLISVIDNKAISNDLNTEANKAKMKKLTEAFYHSAKYLLLNNKKK